MAVTLDLNSIKLADLKKVPGISAKLATSLITARDQRGGFDSLDDALALAATAAERQALAAGALEVVVRPPPLRRKQDAVPSRVDAVRITLDPKGEHPGRYGGYKAVFRYRAVPADSNDTSITDAALGGAFDADGALALAVPETDLMVGNATLDIAAPDGAIVATDPSLTPTELTRLVTLPVVPAEPPTTVANDDAHYGLPARLRGRVLDRNGRTGTGTRQVIVWAATAEDPADTDFAALASAVTDAAGYFSTDYPAGVFRHAHATVALGSAAQAAPIHLDADGRFPEDVILVIELPAQDDAKPGCSCAGGGATLSDPDATDLASGAFSADLGLGQCVSFTRPDRTLSEYSYYHVVRTTEPEIKGLTLKEPEKLPEGLWGQLIGLFPSALGAQMRMQVIDPASGTAAASEKPGVQFGNAIPSVALAAKALRNPGKISPQSLVKLQELSQRTDLVRQVLRRAAVAPGRVTLDRDHPVDWDDEPTVYQACSIAHGHILHFKQEWVADGYSMGKLLYSLPLAPGQKKQIATTEWSRGEATAREENLSYQDAMQASTAHDNDISTIVDSVLNESLRAGSSAETSTVSAAGGVGFSLGFISVGGGVSGGTASSSSSAWQDASRSLAANSLQSLRDRTSQAASSLRQQRSTVIQTVSQHESVSAVTETVANYNHCHAITMEYFEVLRHLLVRQRLVDVQECLFIPLEMSRFDEQKALRWKSTLQSAMPTAALRRGFDALERIAADYEGSNLPAGMYADEALNYIEGELTLRFQLARPRDVNDDFDAANWQWLTLLIPSLSASSLYASWLRGQADKDRIFFERFGQQIALAFIDSLRFSWVDGSGTKRSLPIDATLTSSFVNDRALAVSLRLGEVLIGEARNNIRALRIEGTVTAGGGTRPADAVLPANSRVIVEGGRMAYRTAHAANWLFNSTNIRNDLTGADAVLIATPLNAQELRNPREEDKELARQLLDHLNEHIERYHHVLWQRMDPNRRYMLLDGFAAPNSQGRSVASVVENRLVGIAGNSLIMPVSPGYHLDPTWRQDAEHPVDLLEHYQPNTPIEPIRIALPTPGVYAEAVMGACNSCEHKEEDRFWRWEESPIPDNPPAIAATSTDSRRADPPDTNAKDFPAPIIAMQSIPAAPAPTALDAALGILGKDGLFKDLTGLDANQKNALTALTTSLGGAQAIGTKAMDLALQGRMRQDIDRALKTIGDAKDKKLIDEKQAGELTGQAIQAMIGGGAQEKKKDGTQDLGKLADSAGRNNAAISVDRGNGERVSVDAKCGCDDAAKPGKGKGGTPDTAQPPAPPAPEDDAPGDGT